MTHHSGRGKCPYKTSDQTLVDGRPLGHSTLSHDHYRSISCRIRETGSTNHIACNLSPNFFSLHLR